MKNFELYHALVEKSLNTHILCTIEVHQKHYSVKIGSVSFFSSSDMRKFHQRLRCHTISINSSFDWFFTFFTFTMPSQTFEKNNSIRTIFFVISIIKINIIKIYTKNTHFITARCDITRIFIKKE